MAYSFSQIGVYQTCQLKYQYQYIDKIKLVAREETADLVLGSLVHETLERLYKHINNLHTPTSEATTHHYQSLRDQRIQQSETNPIIIKGDNQIEDYIRRGHHYIRQYYQTFAPFDQGKILSVEKQQILEIKPGVKFRGIIDRVDLARDILMIHDYKTNKHLPPSDDTHHIEQLTLYAAIVREQYGHYASKTIGTLHYLHFDKTLQRDITPESIDAVLTKYRDIISQIEHQRFEQNMGIPDVFKPTKNPYCSYCDYRSICPLRKHLQMQDESVPALSNKTIKGLIDEYVTASKSKSQADNAMKSIKPYLISYAQRTGVKQLFGEEYALSYGTQVSNKILNKQELAQKLQEIGLADQASSPDTSKIASLLKSGQLTQEQLAGLFQSGLSDVLRSVKKQG